MKGKRNWDCDAAEIASHTGCRLRFESLTPLKKNRKYAQEWRKTNPALSQDLPSVCCWARQWNPNIWTCESLQQLLYVLLVSWGCFNRLQTLTSILMVYVIWKLKTSLRWNFALQIIYVNPPSGHASALARHAGVIHDGVHSHWGKLVWLLIFPPSSSTLSFRAIQSFSTALNYCREPDTIMRAWWKRGTSREQGDLTWNTSKWSGKRDKAVWQQTSGYKLH